ncbi:MAG: circularly permuted type 2 ATP-grasp protein [Acidobacteria bacterium]|nr:circularly permuted type 2 ATP-grasp protein [Acidobacteriota bacterium]
MASPIDVWHGLLRPDVEQSAEWWQDFSAKMRQARLTFGDRLTCPFLRPFFLTHDEVDRVRHAAETMAVVGEKVVAAAMADPSLLDELGLSDAERTLIAYAPGYDRASTASRLDAFLLPDSLKFAEYNAESPAGLAYTESLANTFDSTEIMARFRERFDATHFRLCDLALDALIASYREWGGTASPPHIAIVDFRGVPTWNEFLIMKGQFEARGVPTTVADPRELEFDGSRLVVGGRAIDLVYRRALVNDILAHPDETRALVEAYAARAVCVANTFRCKIAHKKTFFAVLTDERFSDMFTGAERAVIDQHVPWTRVVCDRETMLDGRPIDLLEHLRAHRDDFVVKPSDEYGGTGVTLGWELDQSAWDAALERAVVSDDVWIAQRRIAIRRETFPIVATDPHRVEMRDMLVDFAPYLFRGRLAGFLTRLSASGLANVTSGGGQVPSYVVSERGAR